MNFIFHSVGKNNPKWRTHIFQRGRSTTNQIIYTYFHYTGFWALSITHKKIAHLNYVVLFVIPYPAQQTNIIFGGNAFHALFTPFHVFERVSTAFQRIPTVLPRPFHGSCFFWVFFFSKHIYIYIYTSIYMFFFRKNKTWNSQTSFLPLQFW